MVALCRIPTVVIHGTVRNFCWGVVMLRTIFPCVVIFGTVCPVVRHGTLFGRAQLCG